MEQSIYEIGDKNDIIGRGAKHWVVSNKNEGETLKWYLNEIGESCDKWCYIRKLTEKEVIDFEVFDSNEIYDTEDEEVQCRIENGEITDFGCLITHIGKEVFEMDDAPIFICATTEY